MLTRMFVPSGDQSAEERFMVVVWWSVVALIVTAAVVCAASRHCWKALFSVWLSVYVVLVAVYVVVFTDIASRRVRRRNFFQTRFDTKAPFDSQIAPIADYPSLPKTEGKEYHALSMDEIRGALPDYDAVVRSELDHRIEYGHYSDCPDRSLVRPRWGGRGGDIPGLLGGVW